jgi:uncharacterized membrane protein YhaH (DUF805 family)
MVSFPEAVGLFFKRYVDFQGRSRRSEYWWVQLLNFIIFFVGVVLAMVVGGFDPSGASTDINPIGMVILGVLGLYGLAIILPSIALFVRRLHDINQTGWIYLGLVVAGLIPLVNLIAAIAQIVIGCIPGTVGANKYGPDPKNPSVAADVFV